MLRTGHPVGGRFATAFEGSLGDIRTERQSNIALYAKVHITWGAFRVSGTATWHGHCVVAETRRSVPNAVRNRDLKTMRLLLVEDHNRFAESIKVGLENQAFAVDMVDSGAGADAAVASVQYDAIILDLGLPDTDGLTLLKQWREQGNVVPVLILTARDGLDDRVKGLNTGADDYLLKPFEMEELVARIRALLRRPGGVLGLVMTAGNVSFDTTAREVRVNDQPISISRREMGVLEQLMRRYGRVVPKSVLEDKIYGFDEEVSSNSVEVHVSRLRKRLTKNGANVSVHTLRGVGYLLSEGSLNN